MSIRLAMLGDSIAAGRGAARRTETAGARLAQRLRDEGYTVTTRVFAAPGARSDALAEQARRAAAWRPTVAVVVIGANDLIHRTHAGRAAHLLGDAVHLLRGAGSEVVVAPAPDLSALPDTPPGLVPVLRAASMLLRDSQVIAAHAAGAHVADRDHATARAFAADRTLFCSDRFHPSSAGYAVIADALHPAVADALAARGERTDHARTSARSGSRAASVG